MVVFLEVSPPIALFNLVASSRKSPGWSKLLPFKNYGGHCSIIFWSLSQTCASTQSCLWALQAVPSPHGLVFALICTVSCETLYRQVCAFPNHVQSIQFTTGGQCVETSQRWSREMGGKVFPFLVHLQKFLKSCFCFVIYGVLGVDWWGKK